MTGSELVVDGGTTQL